MYGYACACSAIDVIDIDGVAESGKFNCIEAMT